ncbi:MAG: YlmC/YmxH family sporulation protein [Firmicutes bacterium]|nr:YlmC/YmxH family sporulation protein [Bacillota bacterium]
MKLSELQDKDIVNINDGKKIGKIVDAKINSEGFIEYLVVDERRNIRNILSSNSDINISFKQIKRIGSDVILVEL